VFQYKILWKKKVKCFKSFCLRLVSHGPFSGFFEKKKRNYSVQYFFLIKLLHSGCCRSPYSTLQKAAPKSDIETNKMKSLSVGKAKPCGTSISEAFIHSVLKPSNKWSWLRRARGNSATSSSRAKQGVEIVQWSSFVSSELLQALKQLPQW